ncbi:MAG: sugar phosphate isomerase/epimerase [Anaerolineae bacterium]|nr:sugar phosphate isomerase/epimerase [Anaerolineae bacterium]
MAGTTQKAPIGLQLYSVRAECGEKLPATLEAIAEIGYVGVEPWGYQGDQLAWQGWSARDLRAMLDDNALTCCGMHLATGALLGDNLSRTIELNQTLGNTFLIIAADSQRMKALDTIMELAGILNHAAEVLKPLGMWTGYHAHGFDFARVGEQTAWETLFENTDDAVVMQLDIGNCVSGGGDPIAMLEKFPGRARSVHLKDYGGPPGSVIGEGKADWTRIFHLCDTLHQPQWYVVEEGSADGTGLEIPARSLQALKAMGR